MSREKRLLTIPLLLIPFFLFSQEIVSQQEKGSVADSIGHFSPQQRDSLNNILNLINLKTADSLHRIYQFEQALDLYENIIENSTDSTLIVSVENRILQSENGLNLLEYSIKPSIIAKKSVQLADFFLNFPDLGDQSWIPIPNPFVSGSHRYYTSIYSPNGRDKIYFSAPDESGAWNIYSSTRIESNLWSEPVMMNENITSSGDEIFPFISIDGQELYFASNGHYGMGGFDLYLSRWDSDINDWGVPINLGFPYSSPGEDILFYNSDDGNFSLFATIKESSGDFVDLIVSEYTSTPIKMAITPQEAREISKFLPLKNDETQIEPSVGTDEMDEYSQLIKQMRQLQDSIRQKSSELNESRELYSTLSNEEDKKYLENLISKTEQENLELNTKLDDVTAKIQKVEIDFLSKGIIPRYQEKKESIPQVFLSYDFEKRRFGEIVDIEVQRSIPQFDYSFKIAEIAVLAEDQTIPEGLVYQIQFMAANNKASLHSMRGLSPVFERKSGATYIYSVGLFRSYDEALSKLNTVRKTGFSSAFITAFNNGKTISVTQARNTEKSIGTNPLCQVKIEGYSGGMSEELLTTLRGFSNKDIAKLDLEGKIVYIVAPFTSRKEAEEYAKKIMDSGFEAVSVETLIM